MLCRITQLHNNKLLIIFHHMNVRIWLECDVFCKGREDETPQIAKLMGQHGAHLGPVGPRWAPCWPHEPCYQGHITIYSMLFAHIFYVDYIAIVSKMHVLSTGLIHMFIIILIGAEVEIFQLKELNTIPDDILAVCIAITATVVWLTLYDKRVVYFHGWRF